MGYPDSLNFSTSFTLSAWVKPGSLPVADSDMMIVSRFSIFDNWEFALMFSTYYSIVNKFGLVASSDGARGGDYAATRYASSAATTNQWYHVVGVYNSSNQTLDMYLNGSLNNGNLEGTIPSSIEAGGSNALVAIGDKLDGDADYFTGLIDEVRIYDRVLSSGEIQQLYNMGR